MANVISRKLLQYLGLTGSPSVRTGSLVPRPATPDADQMLWQDFREAGAVADADIWTKYNTVMQRPSTFEAMLQLWDEMAGWDLLASALVEIVDEATTTDPNSPATLWYQCNDKRFEEELNTLLSDLDVETLLKSQVYYVAALGNSFERLEYSPGAGVTGMSFVHPMEIRRYWLERNRKCIGFRWNGHKADKEDVFVAPDNKTKIERVAFSSGKTTEDLFYPWDFLHFRRMYRLRISEHGEPVFAEAEGIYKKLRIAIDQMVVHRAQVQPDRYSINIDVQEQPPAEQMKTVHKWRQALRSKLAFGQTGDANGLNAATSFSSYYNALALDTILYIAQPKGFKHGIEKIGGTANVPDVYDIELLTDLFYSILGMPRSWFGGKGDSQQAPSGKALLAQDIRFLRKIKSIRQPIMSGYEWLAYFHAVLQGKDVNSLDIRVMMSPIGSLEDQLKMELLEQQAGVLSSLADVMQKYNLPREAWIETVFKRYMHLPDEVVHVFMTALPSEVEAPQMQESVAPTTARLLREIEAKLGQSPQDRALLMEMSRRFVTGQPNTRSQRKKLTEVIHMPALKSNDLIISSFGQNPLRVSGKTETDATSTPGTRAPARELLQEQGNGDGRVAEPYYRQWVGS